MSPKEPPIWAFSVLGLVHVPACLSFAWLFVLLFKCGFWLFYTCIHCVLAIHTSHLLFPTSAEHHLSCISLSNMQIFGLILWWVDFNQGHLCDHEFDTIHWSDSLSQNLSVDSNSAGRGKAPWIPLPVMTVDRDHFYWVQLQITTASMSSWFPWMAVPEGISQPFFLSSISSLFIAVINIISKRHLKKKWVYFILYFQATFNRWENSEQEVKVGVWSRN